MKCGIPGCCDSPVTLLVMPLCVWSQGGKQKDQSVSKHHLKYQVELWKCGAVASQHLERRQSVRVTCPVDTFTIKK